MKLIERIIRSGSSYRIESTVIPDPPLIERFWPWSSLRSLRDKNSQLERQLHACHMAAIGAFHAFPKDGTMFTDANIWSSALAEVMKLCGKLDKYKGESSELIHKNHSVQCPGCKIVFSLSQMNQAH